MKTRREIEELVGKLTDNNELVNLVGRVGSLRRSRARERHIRWEMDRLFSDVYIDTREEADNARLAILMADLIGIGGKSGFSLPIESPSGATLLRGGSGRRYAGDAGGWDDAVGRRADRLYLAGAVITPASLRHLYAAVGAEWTLPLALRCIDAVARADEGSNPSVQAGESYAYVRGPLEGFVAVAEELYLGCVPRSSGDTG